MLGSCPPCKMGGGGRTVRRRSPFSAGLLTASMNSWAANLVCFVLKFFILLSAASCAYNSCGDDAASSVGQGLRRGSVTVTTPRPSHLLPRPMDAGCWTPYAVCWMLSPATLLVEVLSINSGAVPALVHAQYEVLAVLTVAPALCSESLTTPVCDREHCEAPLRASSRFFSCLVEPV